MERETAVARTGVEDAETAIKQEQDDMSNAEKEGLTTMEPETTFEEMLNAIRDSLSNLASSDDVENGADVHDDEEDPAGGKFSEDDKPGWVMGTISNMVQYRMKRFLQMQIKVEESTRPGLGTAVNCFRNRNK